MFKNVIFSLIFCFFLPWIVAEYPLKFSDSNNASYQVTACMSDVMKIFDGFGKREIWAMKVLDASTKFPSGILTGHVTDYGNYDECLANVGGNVTTQHCFANFRVTNISLPTDVNLKFSYCIPASCSAQILETALRSFITEPSLNITVDPHECTNKKDRSISAVDYFGIAVWGLFISLALVSTAYDSFCRMTKIRINPLLSSFSLYTNGLKLLNTNSAPGTLMPLHGLRFLSICWVILGHRCFFTAFSSLLNLTDLITVLHEVSSQIFIQGVMAVDTFFLLSGLLNCYHLLTVMDKTERFPAAAYYLHRYIRLTPVLAAIVLMYATWYILIGDGPHWNQTTEKWKELCVANWWPTLLYINNYYDPTSQCAGQSWYLAVDMQLYWLSPLIIIPLWKKPKLGKIGLGILLLVSVAITFAIAFIYKFRASFSAGFDGFDEFLRSTRLLYVPTHTRATPYIIGIMLGYYLRYLKKNKTILVLSKGLLVAGWLTTTAVCLAIIFGNFQFTRPIEEHPYNRWESSFYISLYRVGWGFGISWIIICCLNNMGGIVNDILSWKGFVPLSRLTYCIFLCHMAIQQYNIGTARTPNYFQYFNQFHQFMGDVFCSIILATVLTLIFESPVMTLEKLLLGKKPSTNIRLKGESNRAFEEDGSNFKDRKLALIL